MNRRGRDQGTPNTAGRDGVIGRTKSQTVTFNLIQTEKFVEVSSSIISTGPESAENLENAGICKIFFKVADVVCTLSNCKA